MVYIGTESMKISASVKVGFLTLVSLFILVFSVMWIKGRAISTGERIEVAFQDVDGMRPGSAVQMMGIRVGQVEDVIPVINGSENFVRVKFVITETGIKIPYASTVSIQQAGIIGEKFLEVTPPEVRTVILAKRKIADEVKSGAEVKANINGTPTVIGKVKDVKVLDRSQLADSITLDMDSDKAYKVSYLIDKPGYVITDDTTAFISDGSLSFNVSNKYNNSKNLINSKYTIVEPLRMREFLELQLASAKALKETNDKINEILSKESISDLKDTLKNTKILTQKASITLDEATKLLSSSRTEMDNLVVLATNLSNKMIVLTDNVNNIVADPELRSDILATVKSVQVSTKQLSTILSDSKLSDTLKNVNSTSQDLSEITANLNNLSKDGQLQGKIEKTVTDMNSSMEKLDKILTSVDGLTAEQEKKLKAIIEDASKTSGNLKQFSDKLNKRFLLFRLMF